MHRAAQAIHAFDEIERHIYTVLRSLLRSNGFWHGRMREQLMEQLDAARGAVAAVSSQEDLQTFIKENQTGEAPPWAASNSFWRS